MVTRWRIFGYLCRIATICGIMHFADEILAVLSATFHLSVASLLLGLFFVAMATNSVKSKTTEQRVNNVVSATGSLNNQVNGPSGLTSRITTLETGTFVNVNGSTVNISGFGGGSLYVTALKLWTDGNEVNFLNTLRHGSVPGSPNAAPSSYSQSWGQNITGVLNTIIANLGGVGVW